MVAFPVQRGGLGAEFPRRTVLAEIFLWLLCLALGLATPLGRYYTAAPLGALTCYLLLFAHKRRAQVATLARLPGPPHSPEMRARGGLRYAVMGAAHNMIEEYQNLPGYHLQLTRQYGSILHDRPTLWNRNGVVFLADPAAVEHVLKTNVDNYVKPAVFRRNFREIFGGGVFNTNHGPHAVDGGRAWYVQRKVAAKVFTAAKFRTTFAAAFRAHGGAVLGALRRAVGRPGGLDVQDLMFRFTLESFGEIGFGVQLGCIDKDVPFSTAFDRAQACAFSRYTRPGAPELYYWSAPERELRAQVAVMDAFAARTIATRRAELLAAGGDADAGDLLSLFLRADYSGYAAGGGGGSSSSSSSSSSTDGGNGSAGAAAAASAMPTDKFLRDVVLNFAVAGRDTTACTLTFAVHALCREAAVERKLAAEVADVLQGALPTFETVTARAMPYLHGFVQEVLRLWPPVPFDVKQCCADDVLPGGQAVPAGTTVLYLPFAMGRDAALWGEDAEELRPERWMASEGGSPVCSAYRNPVFQAGPRICLGIQMAQFEVKMLVAMMVQKFTFSPVPGHEDAPMQVNITLSVKDGLHVRVADRDHQ